MRSIAVDMDGVLADVYHQFIDMHLQETGKKLQLKALKGLSERAAFPFLEKHVNSKGFFINAPMVPDSRRVLELLHNQYRVFIVSAATEFPLSLSEKQAWLNRHFPFISWRQMVFCGSKEIIHTDIMIDDHFKNLDHFRGEGYLFTQPHNELSPAGKHKRVDSWRALEKLLL
ncbi:5'(3')-deoxyribonucleotidase [Cyclobacterium lianum]|uniref:5'(3')-deoxyribonucleotidase n=1 Tax=Cyclobacterium lianum TaxID=388280 RepID=A0A1M7MN74_9BACT|nr:5'(3')-deoxyribonucleotidase [Cyclobacterium lianum]SHM92435.1 5'(3')-deoxyribonucleotidase [Cyclobacterium lianum]